MREKKPLSNDKIEELLKAARSGKSSNDQDEIVCAVMKQREEAKKDSKRHYMLSLIRILSADKFIHDYMQELSIHTVDIHFVTSFILSKLIDPFQYLYYKVYDRAVSQMVYNIQYIDFLLNRLTRGRSGDEIIMLLQARFRDYVTEYEFDPVRHSVEEENNVFRVVVLNSSNLGHEWLVNQRDSWMNILKYFKKIALEYIQLKQECLKIANSYIKNTDWNDRDLLKIEGHLEGVKKELLSLPPFIDDLDSIVAGLEDLNISNDSDNRVPLHYWEIMKRYDNYST